jgi:hypothetical protein
MAAAAGWYPDPEGRAEQRYWDGERWTEHVQRSGEPAVDVIEPKADWQRALDALGPDVRERPIPDLLGALAAGGGTLTAIGALVLGAGDDGDNRPGILIASALLVVIAYVVAAVGDRRLRPSAVAVAALGVVVFVFEAFRDSVADGRLAAPFIVLALLTLVMYAAPILRGRPFLLGVALTSLVGCLAFLVAGDLGSDNVSDASNIGASAAEDAYAALLLAGVVLLVAAFLLDHVGYHGVATVFVAVAVISVVAGAFGTAARFDEVGGAILVALAGLGLALVGYFGQRRFTTWFGAAVVTYGVAALVLAIVSSDDRVGGGILLAVFGAGLVAVSFLLPRIWRARANQSTQLPPPTAS